MRFDKLGRVFVAEGQHSWMQTHAAWPRALHLRADIFRVFCSVRDGRNRSHIAFVDIDVNHPTDILSVSTRPVLAPGPPGSFDESGVIPCCVLRLGDRHALYYAGVSAAEAGSFACLCGLAYLDDALCTATRALTGPLLERDEADPHSGGVVCVSPQPARETLHMWYESRVSSPGPLPRFAIKHSVSRDGIAWNRLDEVSIGDDGERSYVSNPSVLIDETGFRMWYSYKVGERYRIGYAESDDGRTWKRSDDSAGIAPSSIGWDSDDVEYPSVFTHGRDLYMLYNGNEYGRTGFGMARLARS